MRGPTLSLALTLVTTVAALGGLACDSSYAFAEDVSVSVEVNEALDFSQFERFDLVNPVEELYEEPPAEYDGERGEILAGIEGEFSEVGLTRSSVDVDLLVTPYLAIEPSEDFIHGYFGYYWGYDFSWAAPVEHERGTLVIDVVAIGDPDDAEDDVLAFRGVVRGVRAKSREGLRATVRRALMDVFAAFPEV